MKQLFLFALVTVGVFFVTNHAHAAHNPQYQLIVGCVFPQLGDHGEIDVIKVIVEKDIASFLPPRMRVLRNDSLVIEAEATEELHTDRFVFRTETILSPNRAPTSFHLTLFSSELGLTGEFSEASFDPRVMGGLVACVGSL